MSKHLIIKEARCSFPQLYGSRVEDGEHFGPGIVLVLEKEKHKGVIEQIKALMREAIAENPKLSAQPPKGDKLCLRRPDRDELNYLEGNLILRAGNPNPPVVLYPDGKTIMTEATNKIYSGCYVNAKVEIWGQVNKFGKRVNAKLIAVQYVPKDAPSFDGTYVSPEEAVKGFGSLVDDDADLGFGSAGGESMGEVLGKGQEKDPDDLLG
jgi:hypothetical protein